MRRATSSVILLSWIASVPTSAYELTESLSIGGVVALYQATGAGENGRAAAPFQPELSFHPGEWHEVFVKLGFARGNGLNPGAGPGCAAPWAADLEAAVKDINGGGRSHLLTAGYRYAADLRNGHTVAVTAGIIDSTEYLDDNAFANDEYAQFMNAVFVNGPILLLPSYERGVAISWSRPGWSGRGVYMNRGADNTEGRSGFVGAQVGYHASTALGPGSYRLVVDRTRARLPDQNGAASRSGAAVGLSCDQRFGDMVGAFIRLAWKDASTPIEHAALFSGGFEIQGTAWRRARDRAALGYALLGGGATPRAKSRVVEGYYRLVLNDFLAITADLQLLRDRARTEGGQDHLIAGVRATIEF